MESKKRKEKKKSKKFEEFQIASPLFSSAYTLSYPFMGGFDVIGFYGDCEISILVTFPSSFFPSIVIFPKGTSRERLIRSIDSRSKLIQFFAITNCILAIMTR